MRTRKILNAAVLLLMPAMMMVSCMPTVNTDIMQRYASLPLDSVKVYENSDLVPSSATAIGKINMLGLRPDTECRKAMERVGLTTSDIRRDKNPKVLMAKAMAADAGGNGLLVSNGSEVDYLKSTYFCTILRAEDDVVDGNVVSPAVKAHNYTLETVANQVKQHRVPSNIIKLNVGPACITSNVYTTKGKFSNVSAFNAELQYSHNWKTGWGCGLYAFQSHFKLGESGSYNYEGSANIFFAGPTVSYSYRTTKGWLWNITYGIGYTSMDDGEAQSGFAMTCKLGVDYMLTKHIGVGVDAMDYAGFFSEPDGWKQQHSDERYGFSQMGIVAGLRIYF